MTFSGKSTGKCDSYLPPAPNSKLCGVVAVYLHLKAFVRPNEVYTGLRMKDPKISIFHVPMYFFFLVGRVLTFVVL